MNVEDKPPSCKIADAGDMDISSTDIPSDDIEGKSRMGFWHQFTQPILYPAGNSVCSRWLGIFIFNKE